MNTGQMLNITHYQGDESQYHNEMSSHTDPLITMTITQSLKQKSLEREWKGNQLTLLVGMKAGIATINHMRS